MATKKRPLSGGGGVESDWIVGGQAKKLQSINSNPELSEIIYKIPKKTSLITSIRCGSCETCIKPDCGKCTSCKAIASQGEIFQIFNNIFNFLFQYQ